MIVLYGHYVTKKSYKVIELDSFKKVNWTLVKEVKFCIRDQTHVLRLLNGISIGNNESIQQR